MTGRTNAVKGTHVVTSRTWVDEREGAGTFDRLSLEAEAPWGSTVLPSSWYDVQALLNVTTPVIERHGLTVLEAFSEIAAQNASDDLRTIYRAFLRLAGARGLLNATPALWKNYVNFGIVKKIRNEPGLHEGTCRAIPTPLLEWAIACWNGFIPTAVVIAGGKDAKLELVDKGEDKESSTPGLSYLHIVLTYKP